MARDMMPGDDFDGVQYDTEYAPSAAQLEADEIRREYWRGTCPQCGKRGATAEHVSWCDWEPA